ncbi:MAG: LamG-like jellyroll fold domain-containing protein, partial [Dokdonella sp.]
NLLNMQPQMTYGIDTRVNPEVLAKGRSYHVIMTCDGVVNEMYINGHRMQTQSMSAANVPADPHVWVGSQPAQQRPYRIDTFGHIALYDHVLSQARIIAHGRATGLYGQ